MEGGEEESGQGTVWKGIVIGYRLEKCDRSSQQ